ncbi:MAG: LuxR family transcriptional regulator [Neisseriaceae bacterium]|nr:MAG: LuxR family transcriptional regulator [Neisseriaceae bacterium]
MVQIQNYLENVVIANFIPLVEQKFFSSIINKQYEIVICTNYTAKAFGFNCWQEIREMGISSKKFNDPDLAKLIFKDSYNDQSKEMIHDHLYRYFLLQKYVLTEGKIISYIDMLPYDNQLKSYMVTATPIIYENSIVGLQTFSTEISLFYFQKNLDLFSDSDYSNHKYFAIKDLSNREYEVLFLLSNGLNQERIAQILGVTRNTIATIIRNLCTKFQISGSNSKLLADAAYNNGFFKQMPASLWKPCIIVSNDELSDYINFQNR